MKRWWAYPQLAIRSTIGVLATVSVLTQVWPESRNSSSPSPAPGEHSMRTVSIEAPAAIPPRVDRLPVVNVAPFPTVVEREWAKNSGAPTRIECPVKVRAIIADDGSNGFAMLELESDSVSVQPGDTLMTPAGRAKVKSLGSSFLILSGAFGTAKCALDTER